MTSNGHRSEIPDAYLLCRGLLGHQFEPYDVHVTRSDIQLSLQCRNCTTIRHQTLTKTGYIVPGKNRYEYPEQQDSDAEPYCRKGAGRLTVDDRAALRVASIQQLRQQVKR